MLAQYSMHFPPIRDAVSVLGVPDRALVVRISGIYVSAETWQTIAPLITTDWHAETHRQTLVNERPDAYHTCCEHALDTLAASPRYEPQLTFVAQHWGNVLLNEDPAAFARLVDRLRSVTFAQPDGQHLRAYFEAAMLVRSAEFDTALSQLNTLLADPTIDPYIRARSLNARAVCQRAWLA